MGKRQIRIRSAEIEVKITEILNKSAQFVLKNGVTIHGKMITFENHGITILDAFKNKHVLEKEALEEVFIDYTAPF